MQVILLSDVPNLGKKGETKEVKPGYFRNFLWGKYAVLPNDPKAKEVEEQRKAVKGNQKEDKKEELANLGKISGKKFIFKAKADKKGKLYGSIGPKEIAQKIGVEEKQIKKHFKEIGNYDLEIIIGDNKFPIKIEIEKE